MISSAKVRPNEDELLLLDVIAGYPFFVKFHTLGFFSGRSGNVACSLRANMLIS